MDDVFAYVESHRQRFVEESSFRREDETAAFVAAADDLEEEVGGPGDERGERVIRSF